MPKIFIPHEVDHNKYVIDKGPHGYFSNLEAAEAYVQECVSPYYNRIMMIQEVVPYTSWPIKEGEVVPPVMTYYHQANGVMVREGSVQRPVIVKKNDYSSIIFDETNVNNGYYIIDKKGKKKYYWTRTEACQGLEKEYGHA